jgi:hypothetical protein
VHPAPFNLINWHLSRNNLPKGCCLLLLGGEHRMLELMRKEH